MILVSGGCSFSDCSYSSGTWPEHLAKILDYKHYSTGLGSQGNGLISRKVLYTVQELLSQNADTSQILVSIMWSGPNRGDYYSEKKQDLMKNGEIENPTTFVDNDPGGWVIMNQHWNDKSSRNYYKNIYNDSWGLIQTLEHVLRTQWFLKLNNINYIMMAYTDNVFNTDLVNQPNVSWLYKQIDWSNFVSRQGEYEWLKINANHLGFCSDGFHPSSEQHLFYVENVIVPHLEKNRLITSY